MLRSHPLRARVHISPIPIPPPATGALPRICTPPAPHTHRQITVIRIQVSPQRRYTTSRTTILSGQATEPLQITPLLLTLALVTAEWAMVHNTGELSMSTQVRLVTRVTRRTNIPNMAEFNNRPTLRRIGSLLRNGEILWGVPNHTPRWRIYRVTGSRWTHTHPSRRLYQAPHRPKRLLNGQKRVVSLCTTTVPRSYANTKMVG